MAAWPFLGSRYFLSACGLSCSIWRDSEQKAKETQSLSRVGEEISFPPLKWLIGPHRTRLLSSSFQQFLAPDSPRAPPPSFSLSRYTKLGDKWLLAETRQPNIPGVTGFAHRTVITCASRENSFEKWRS